MSFPGRNDPCHCGSGNKYKRCCLEKDQAAERNGLRLVVPEPASPKSTRPAEKIRLSDIRRAIDREMEWGNTLYSILAHHLVNAMEPYYEEPLILEAVSFWNAYSSEMEPLFQKLGTYCAALEYFIVQAYGFPVTQAGLAAKYNVSAATVSKRYQGLLEFVDRFHDPEDDGPQSVSPYHRMDMERDMRSMELTMKDQNFKTMEEAQTFINQWMNKPIEDRNRKKRDKREEAQDLLYDAERESSVRRRVQLARKAIELYPDSPDAYRILAEHADSIQESLRLLKQGIQAGERDLGHEFFQQEKGHFWGIVVTRPYMRVKYAYAETCWLTGDLSESAAKLEEILELNPMDNMGARHLLAGVYLESNRLRDAEKLLQSYEEDETAVFAYSRMILEFKKNGINAKLAMLYNTARQQNKHVPDYLFGKRSLPESLPEYVGFGDDNEAIDYVAFHSRVWVNLPELLEWIMKKT